MYCIEMTENVVLTHWPVKSPGPPLIEVLDEYGIGRQGCKLVSMKGKSGRVL